MGKLFILAFLLAAAYYGARHFGLVGHGGDLEVTTSTVRADIDGVKVTYSVNGPAAETYMVMSADTRATSIAQGMFLGLEATAIRSIARRYPDYHRCDSPGAPEAQRLAEHVNVVGDRKVMGLLHRAGLEAESRERGKGERLCAAVKGQWLTFEEAEKGETKLTGEQYRAMTPAHAFKQYFLHLQSLETRDCKDFI